MCANQLKNKTRKRITVQIIIILLLNKFSNGNEGLKIITKEDFKQKFNKLKKIYSYERMRFKTGKEDIFFLFYQTETGANVNNIAYVKINGNGIETVDQNGDVSGATIGASKKIDSTFKVYLHQDPLPTIPYQFVIAYSKTDNNIVFYDNSLSQHTSTNFETLTSPVFLLNFSASSTSGPIFFFIFSGNTLYQGKITSPSSSPSFSKNNYPSTGLLSVDVDRISSATLTSLYGIYCVIAGSVSHLYLVAKKSGSPNTTPQDHVKITSATTPQEIKCEFLFGHSSNDDQYHGKFFCGNDNEKLEVYEINGGQSTVEATVETFPDSFQYQKYFTISSQKNLGSALEFKDDNRVFYILVEKNSGVFGISICKEDTLKEVYFYKIDQSFNDRLLPVGNTFLLGNIGDNEINPHILYFDFTSFSGVEGCKENKVTDRSGFFSRECKICDSPNYVDSVRNSPKDSCVSKSSCTKGVLDEGNRLCHTSTSCTVNNCIRCQYLKTDICQDCEELFEKNADGTACKSCKVYESYQSGTCFDCLSNNHCSDCEDNTKNCNKCETNFPIKGKDGIICMKDCEDGFVYSKIEEKCFECESFHHCENCSNEPLKCNRCSFGYQEVSPAPTDGGEKLCEKICPQNNFFYDASLCKSCSNFHCTSCQYPDGECLICEQNYVKDKIDKKLCKKCEAHESFESESKTCFNCLENNNCLKCEDITKECSECKEGFIKDPNNDTLCKECEAHESFQSDSKTCFDCFENNNCLECLDFTKKCSECKEGFIKDPNNDALCKKCEANESFQKDSKSCFDCLKNNNCLECSDLTKKCSECKEGFIIDPKNSTRCQKCETHESFQKDSKTCFDCLKINNCLECSDFTKECSKCKPGYILKHSQKEYCKEEIIVGEITLTSTTYLNSKEKIELKFSQEIFNPTKILFNEENKLNLPVKGKEKHGFMIRITNPETKEEFSDYIQIKEITLKNPKELEIKISFKKTLNPGQIELHRTYQHSIVSSSYTPDNTTEDHPFLHFDRFNPDSNSTLIKKFPPENLQGQDPKTTKTLETVGNTSRTATNVFIGLAFIFALPVFFLMIKVLQYIDYTMLISVILPRNIQTFLNFFKRNSFSFIPNVFLDYNLNFKGDYQCETDGKLAENEIECLLLDNVGSQLIQFLLFGVLKIFLFGILYLMFWRKENKNRQNMRKKVHDMSTTFDQLEVEKTNEEKKEKNYFFRLYKFINFSFFINTANSMVLDFFISSVVNIEKMSIGGNFYITFNLILSFILSLCFIALIIWVLVASLQLQKAENDELMKIHLKSKKGKWLFFERRP